MARRILVLAVDRDDDLGSAGLRTPIVGRDQVLEAAIRFALSRPEDSDANVLFAAVKLADELRMKGYDPVVAVVSGHPVDTVEADMRIKEQVEEIASRHNVSDVVLVSDGTEDELVLPVLQQVVRIVSVKRVIVEQHRGIEETYMLIARYLRKAVEEPRFARLFLGVPGVVLVVFSSLALVGYLWQAILLGLLVGGLAMVIRGFGIEDRIVELFTRTPITMIAYSVSAIIAVTGIGLTAYYLSVTWQEQALAALADALRSASSFLGLAASIAIISHAVTKIMAGNVRVGREVTSLAVVVVVVLLVDSIAQALRSASTATGAEAAVAVLSSLLQGNFAFNALGGVLSIAVIWRLSSYLEDWLSRETGEASEASETREQHEEKATVG